MDFSKFREKKVKIVKDRELSRNIKSHPKNAGFLPFAVANVLLKFVS